MLAPRCTGCTRRPSLPGARGPQGALDPAPPFSIPRAQDHLAPPGHLRLGPLPRKPTSPFPFCLLQGWTRGPSFRKPTNMMCSVPNQDPSTHQAPPLAFPSPPTHPLPSLPPLHPPSPSPQTPNMDSCIACRDTGRRTPPPPKNTNPVYKVGGARRNRTRDAPKIQDK